MTQTEIARWMDRYTEEETRAMAALWQLGTLPGVRGTLSPRYARAARVLAAIGGAR